MHVNVHRFLLNYHFIYLNYPHNFSHHPKTALICRSASIKRFHFTCIVALR